jgi:hypothetical protein
MDLDKDEVRILVENTQVSVRRWVETFRKHTSANLFMHSFEVTPYAPCGVREAQGEGLATAIGALNEGLREIVKSVPGVYVLDYDHLISRYGCPIQLTVGRLPLLPRRCLKKPVSCETTELTGEDSEVEGGDFPEVRHSDQRLWCNDG